MDNPIRSWSAILLLLAIATTARSQQIDSLRAFFPLEIGNEWHYEERFNSSIANYRMWRRVVRDTVMPNGSRYFVIVDTEQLQPSILYARFDSTTGEFRMYDPGGGREGILFTRIKPEERDTVLGIPVVSHITIPAYRYKGSAMFAYGIGPFYESAMNPLYQLYTSWHLVYANVGGREYGTPMSVTAEAVGRQQMLEGNAPNPVTSTTSIRFSIPHATGVTLRVLDPLGACIATLVDERREAGSYTTTFDASTLPNGVYFYQLMSDDGVLAKPMIVAR